MRYSYAVGVFGTVVVRLSAVVCRPNGCTVAKRCEIRPRLLLITTRKSQVGFQMS